MEKITSCCIALLVTSLMASCASTTPVRDGFDQTAYECIRPATRAFSLGICPSPGQPTASETAAAHCEEKITGKNLSDSDVMKVFDRCMTTEMNCRKVSDVERTGTEIQ